MTALLIVIFIVFVSLGLPDSLFGAAWPVTHKDLGVAENFASYYGIITGICTGGVSFIAGKMLRKFGTARVTLVSTFLTVAALIGMSFSPNIIVFMFFTVVLGYGAGAIDTGLNNFVSLHYEARHMNWLHCCWGVGATIGPQIMGNFLSRGMSWNNGYLAISILQGVLTMVLLFSLPLWKKAIPQAEEKSDVKTIDAIKIRGVKLVLIMFFCYCAAESLAMLWASSYLVEYRHVDSITATLFGSLFFVGMTVGRFVCGLISGKLGDRALIRIGSSVALVGVVCIVLPVTAHWLSLCGLVVFGLGCAPIYPAIIHSTPNNFGKKNSQAIVGFQMACAYTGSTFIPPLFGLVASKAMVLFPYIMAVCFVAVVLLHERVNRIIDKRKVLEE